MSFHVPKLWDPRKESFLNLSPELCHYFMFSSIKRKPHDRDISSYKSSALETVIDKTVSPCTIIASILVSEDLPQALLQIIWPGEFCSKLSWWEMCLSQALTDCPSTAPYHHDLLFNTLRLSVSSMWRVASPFFWPLLKANYVRLFSDWGACQYYTVGELSLAPRCILIHEP